MGQISIFWIRVYLHTFSPYSISHNSIFFNVQQQIFFSYKYVICYFSISVVVSFSFFIFALPRLLTLGTYYHFVTQFILFLFLQFSFFQGFFFYFEFAFKILLCIYKFVIWTFVDWFDSCLSIYYIQFVNFGHFERNFTISDWVY